MSSDFDFMTLVAPESRRVIQEQYRKGCCGDHTTKQFNYTGLSKDGRKIECETFILFIPYKWGVAIQGTLRSISMSRRIDEAMQQHQSDMRVALDAPPTGVLYADKDRLSMQANETFGKFDDLPMEQTPRMDYSVKPGNGNGNGLKRLKGRGDHWKNLHEYQFGRKQRGNNKKGRSHVVDDSRGTGNNVDAGISNGLYRKLFHSYPAFFCHHRHADPNGS